MKMSILILYTFLSVSLFSNELEWVNEQIEAIKPSRNGVSKAKINTTKSPFIFLKNKKDESKKKTINNTIKVSKVRTTSRKKSVKKQSKTLHLDAIINHSALINGVWYKRNTKVGKYQLSIINSSNVILTYKKNELHLSMKNKNKKLKFKHN